MLHLHKRDVIDWVQNENFKNSSNGRIQDISTNKDELMVNEMRDLFVKYFFNKEKSLTLFKFLYTRNWQRF